MSYLPCELHCHSVHSDGDYTVCELQKKAIDDHLAIIALTDHNTFSGWDEIDDNIIPVIRGIEWTTYYGHLLVLGANDFVDWRDANADNIDEKIKQIKAVGGLVGVAHPFQLGSPLCTGGHWDFNVRNWQNVDYIEVWHKNLYSNKFLKESIFLKCISLNYFYVKSYISIYDFNLCKTFFSILDT